VTERPARVLPHDLDAEAAVLSALMLDGDRYWQVVGIVHSSDFYADANRWVFRAIEAVASENQKPDSVLVASWLKQHDRLDQVGGVKYLAQIQDATPATSHVESHALIVAKLGYQRRLLALLQLAVAEGFTTSDDAIDWGQSVEARVLEQSRFTRRDEDDGTLKALVPKLVDDLAAEKNGTRGTIYTLATGIEKLDELLDGGLAMGNKYTLAGRPGMGKSALALTIALNVATLGFAVILVSVEMPRGQLMLRVMSQESGVPFGRLKLPKTMTPRDWDSVTGQVEPLRRRPMSVVHAPRATTTDVRSAVRREFATLRRELGNHLELGLVVVDHVHIMNGERQRGENAEQEMTRISKANLGIAGEFGCVVMDLAQLNRDVEKRPDKRPNMTDLRASGSLEEDAYGILFPFRPAYYQKDRPPETDASPPEDIEIALAKHRNGRTGTVTATFHGPTMRFS
jgi:replicative DNA helicase